MHQILAAAAVLFITSVHAVQDEQVVCTSGPSAAVLIAFATLMTLGGFAIGVCWQWRHGSRRSYSDAEALPLLLGKAEDACTRPTGSQLMCFAIVFILTVSVLIVVGLICFPPSRMQ